MHTDHRDPPQLDAELVLGNPRGNDMTSGSSTMPDADPSRPLPFLPSNWLKSALILAGWLGACFGAAWFGAQFSPGEWYAGLNKPPWNPPNWVFGPVWTALYTMMAVAAWLVWRRGGLAVNALPLAAFTFQLVLNALWSWLFFGLRSPALAFSEIVALWFAIVATLLLFRKRNRIAAWLLAPYLAWVSFAAALNFALWRLNAG